MSSSTLVTAGTPLVGAEKIFTPQSQVITGKILGSDSVCDDDVRTVVASILGESLDFCTGMYIDHKNSHKQPSTIIAHVSHDVRLTLDIDNNIIKSDEVDALNSIREEMSKLQNQGIPVDETLIQILDIQDPNKRYVELYTYYTISLTLLTSWTYATREDYNVLHGLISRILHLPEPQ